MFYSPIELVSYFDLKLRFWSWPLLKVRRFWKLEIVWNKRWGLIVVRTIHILFHQTIFHAIIDIQSAFNSVRLLAIPRAKAICLDILNFSRLEFLSLLLLSMTIIVSILFFRRKKWKNALLTRRFFIIESCRHCNHTLSGLASDVTWWGRLPCIYLCRYSLPASQKKKKMAKEIIELLLILITKVHWNFSQNDVV